MSPEERQAILAKAAAAARHNAWNEMRRSFGEEKDGHRTCWGCVHAHFGPMPRRVCSARKDDPYIYGAPYDELKPEYDWGHPPGRTVADDCNLYEHGLPKVLSMEDAQTEEHEANNARNRLAGLGQVLLARFSDPKRDYSEFQRLLRGEADTYKPFYRAISLVLMEDGGVAPGASREDVEAILRATHPYFTGALVRGRSTFDHLYDIFIDL